MTRTRLFSLPLTVLALGVAATGCGSSSNSPAAGAAPASSTSASTPTAPSPTTAAAAPGALTAEANAAAAGDIPDNQVFLTFGDAGAGYSIRYPEGWLQRGNGKNVTFLDKNNRIRIVVERGAVFTLASVRADIARLKTSAPSFSAAAPEAVALPAGSAFKVSYSTESAPNPVTNKRVTLAVDRYYLSKGGKRAIIDLGAPRGVDNVDAFRMISRSFAWR